MAENTNPIGPGLEQIVSTLSQWGANFVNQSNSAFARMTVKDWIRMVVVVGGYLLIRPYIMKLGAKMQEKTHAEESAQEVGSAELNGNDLRGSRRKMPIPGVDSDSDEDEKGPAGAANWGRNARVRQRKFVRKQLEEHERRLKEEAEAESDKDIEEFLVKE